MKRPLGTNREPVSLEGTLLCRMGKSSGQSSLLWRRRFVYFSFADGGSITVYKESPNFDSEKLVLPDDNRHRSVLKKVYRKISWSSTSDHDGMPIGHEIVDFDITSDLPWIAKDVDRDSSSFVVEIASTRARARSSSDGEDSGTVTGLELSIDDENEFDGIRSPNQSVDDDPSPHLDQRKRHTYSIGEGNFSFDENPKEETHSINGNNGGDCKYSLGRAIATANSKGKPLRIYFRCEQGSNEKALWLRAFATFGRLSSENRRQRGLISAFTTPLNLGSSRARIRNRENSLLARDTRNLDLTERGEEKQTYVDSVERLVLGNNKISKDREFRVVPTYAYRHRWMTRAEMLEEMLVASEYFHDLRVPGCTDKEIGSLKVEVLQCIGLPKFDRAHDTNGVTYLVCGAYSFVTDVIPNCNPMWLRKSRRACIFPIFHGYARLYAGVFSDEPKKTKDEFAGRVEINVSKLRPNSVYDVTLPLRLSTHVYSRRKRGAIRLRFSLNWHSERDALLSYIPKKIHIPLPQNSMPNYGTTVRCTDPKAFRNIALTVHGAHLPARFTFERMRAAIREINFTRKYMFTALRQSVRELRQWQYPSISAYVFCSWMHCIYANQFSLVPAYVVLFFFIILMCNYVRYNTDEPAQRGFIPPSWEEMFVALVSRGNPGKPRIAPLELVPRKTKARKSISSVTEQPCQYKVSTHKPKGKGLLRLLGLMPTKPRNVEEEHLEFCFANGIDYPKFTVKECIIQRKSNTEDPSVHSDGRERLGSHDTPATGLNPIARLRDVDLHAIMKTDTSGTQEFDEEEMNFKPSNVVLARGKKAKSKIFKTASALREKTVLSLPNVSHVNYVSSSSVHTAKNLVGSSITNAGRFASFRNNILGSDTPRGDFSSMRRPSYDSKLEFVSEEENVDDGHESVEILTRNSQRSIQEYHTSTEESGDESQKNEQEEIDPNLVFPDQDIDVEGPKNGKLLTDDLAEIQDKMHELTWHLFDDQTYVIKNANTVYFGDSKKPEKWRKADVKKQLDKSLAIGQYSYSNPFIARVGMYVEPIIGSAYSFLCFFRAGFNLLTWRDPMMTFWLSLASGILVIILFIFPWRLFLLITGLVLVGPQNWVIRIMREKGRLQPEPEYKSVNQKLHLFSEDIIEAPTDAPIFTAGDRKPGNEPTRSRKAFTEDPREIHHIVIPYSPLVYNRCYDWPPEPQYAHVKRETLWEEKYNKPTNLESISSGLSKFSLGSVQIPTRRDSFGHCSLGIHNRRTPQTIASNDHANETIVLRRPDLFRSQSESIAAISKKKF